MIHGETILAIIPARGGSKSIPHKNIKMLGGKPLLVWAIAAAKEVEAVDRILVSTDDITIAEVAEENGAEVMMRPAELAKDDSLVIDAIKDIIFKLKGSQEEFDIILLLEPTSPFRSKEDIEACLELLTNTTEKLDSVATFVEASLNPHRAWRITDNKPETFIPEAIPGLPRQKLPHAYQLNGAVYACRTEQIEKGVYLLSGNTGAIIMPKERSIDIDDSIDFMLAEALIKERGENL